VLLLSVSSVFFFCVCSVVVVYNMAIIGRTDPKFVVSLLSVFFFHLFVTFSFCFFSN